MTTFKDFLASDKSVKKLIGLLDTKYSDAWQQGTKKHAWLYRGTNSYYSIDEMTKSYTRTPRGDGHINYLIQVLPSWQKYPSRIKDTHICGTDPNTLEDLINPPHMNVILPANGAKLAVVPGRDWNFDTDELFPRLGLASEYLQSFSSAFFSDHTLQTLQEIKTRLKKIQGMLGTDLKNVEGVFDDIINGMYFTKAERKNIQEILYAAYVNNGKDVLKMFDWLFDPAPGGFFLTNTKGITNITKGDAREVWFTGDALIINTNYQMELEELLEKYRKVSPK